MTKTYFRIQTDDRDTADLLTEGQISRNWADETNEQPGVSVCDSLENLATYLAQSGIPIGLGEWVIVELTGDRIYVDAHDAALGELLVQPTEILSVGPADDDFYEMIGAAYDALEG